MKFIRLKAEAYAGGVLRKPEEGVVYVSDAEGDRLIGDGHEDVSADFAAPSKIQAAASD